MDFQICCVIFYTLVANYVETCEIITDQERCAYIVTCEEYIDSYISWSAFESHPITGVVYEYESDEDILCPRPVLYHGQKVYPVYFVFTGRVDRDGNSDNIIPPRANDWEEKNLLNIIYGLELSDKGYQRTPIINSLFNLVKLNISNNYLTTAVLSNDYELNRLTELDLSYNTISDIQINYDQYPYKNLIKIDLSHNNLVKLADGIFNESSNLQKLNLSYNYIDTLTPTTFENVKIMEELVLSHNKLTSINASLFRFNKLKVLDLSGNKLCDLNLTDFEPLYKLEMLDVSSNDILTIYDDAFAIVNVLFSFQSLKSIDLSKNKLKVLPKGLFQNTTVFTFSIEGNRLEGSLERGMLQGINVTKIDLSGQFLTEVNNYTFYDHSRLERLFLQSNNIKVLSTMCFKNLINLRQLDLSNNQITKISFYTMDLKLLKSLILNNNQISNIEREPLQYLTSLEYLDLSENYLSRLEPSTFQSLSNLINLNIHNNPLIGTLLPLTFDGLVSLPNLDLSRKKLTAIQNTTFNNMIQLKDLNVSHCEIREVQYNTFIHTGYIETLDLSHNKLEDFIVNITQLVRLHTLLLNNNLIKIITLSTFNKIVMSRIEIENIYNESFYSLIHLRNLDVSFNENLNFNARIFDKLNSLNTLNLSGLKSHVNFAFLMKNCSITDLNMSNGTVENINELNLSKLTGLYSLDLSYNKVSMLQIGVFSNLRTLKILDLSFNQITSIQPGVFKDNSGLYFLNISHNFLSHIGYGIFRGLIKLSILDMSYNNIKDLETERFYEVESLSELIVDYNKIESFDVTEFQSTRLSKLSIGDNPLPCQYLVQVSNMGEISVKITAIKIDEHSNENVKGVTCNIHNTSVRKSRIPDRVTDNDKELNKSQNVINSFYNKPNNTNIQYLRKISEIIAKLSDIISINNNTSSMLNKTNKMLNESNIILNRIMKNEYKPIKSSKQNIEAPIFTTRIPFKENNCNVNKTMDEEKSVTESEKFVLKNKSKSSLFTETCLGLILLILVGLVLYKIYNSRKFIRNRLSFNERALPGSSESSAL